MRILLLVILIFAIVPISLLILPRTVAAPMPRMMWANHETRECITWLGGDECMACALEGDWEQLGPEGEAVCPEGYATASPDIVRCTGRNLQFCCTIGHSGVSGDCRNLIIDHISRLRAFSKENCTLPPGWKRESEAKPGGVTT